MAWRKGVLEHRLVHEGASRGWNRDPRHQMHGRVRSSEPARQRGREHPCSRFPRTSVLCRHGTPPSLTCGNLLDTSGRNGPYPVFYEPSGTGEVSDIAGDRALGLSDSTRCSLGNRPVRSRADRQTAAVSPRECPDGLHRRCRGGSSRRENGCGDGARVGARPGAAAPQGPGSRSWSPWRPAPGRRPCPTRNSRSVHAGVLSGHGGARRASVRTSDHQRDSREPLAALAGAHAAG